MEQSTKIIFALSIILLIEYVQSTDDMDDIYQNRGAD